MKRRDKGQVLVLVALAIFVLLGFAALGIDVGFMYSVRHELQRSADAGALAGASAFTTGKWDDPSVRGIAEDRARTFASKDTVVTTLLNSAEPPIGEVHVDIIHQKYDHIEVVTQRNADLFFARIFGMSNRVITARAVARAEVTDIKSDCVKPFAIPYPWDDVTPPASLKDKKGLWDGLYDPGETVWKTPPNLTQGTLMTVKAGVPAGMASYFSPQQTAGQFFLVQGNNPTNDNPEVQHWQASEERDYIDGGKCWEVSLSNPVDTMTGGKVGLVDQAVKALIASDNTGAIWDTTKNAPSDMSSTRVIRILMYDPSIDMIISGGGGSGGASGTNGEILANNYTIAGFWLAASCAPKDAGNTITVGSESFDCPQNADKGAVIGRYLANMGSGSSTGNTPPNPTGTEVKKIALVE
jgi:hypothetical protein